MITNDPHLNLVDMCHIYGASEAAKIVCPLTERAYNDWSWFVNFTKLRSPADLLVRHLSSRGDLKLQYSLDLIESQPELGAKARNIVVNWFLFYEMLEVGIQSGVLGPELPENFANSARQEFLVVPEHFWTGVNLTLLSEFHRRLLEDVTRRIDSGPAAHDLFQRFVILNSSIRSDPNLLALSDLTKISFESYQTKLENALETPRKFVEAFTSPSSDGTEVVRVWLGVSRSFYFLTELLNLIQEAGEEHPYLAASIRSYNEYWTDLLSSVTGERTISTMFDGFERWAEEANDVESLEEIKSVRRSIGQFQPRYA